ncbi:WXG100 family type VII secretion target [Saccharothrix coeruleofusca]|uniref:WXG100 family type VII secretion target n=1 Tax=Saccharothrix coeruleofusca TaxID=33919 RepID=UPI001AEB5B3A|nr:WXG100 family type VII secretion target [Saccharothrix coeruleofusca]MBP2338220.1 WXG100 family type VII secretion target [Saccharothrix coeruleofusca]
MNELSGYEIYQMVSRGAGPDGLTQAADVSRDARTRIEALGDELRRLTAEAQAEWRGRASERAAQAAQPIGQALQRAQEALDKADASLRAQAQNYGVLRQQVQPMATPYPPELTFFDEITPWDTDNELARKAWFEADAHNRRVYAEYAAVTGRNQAMLPQVPPASGGVMGADTAVQATGGAGARSATSAPPQVGSAGSTSPSSAGSAGGGEVSAPPSTSGGGGRTSASSAGRGDGGPTSGGGGGDTGPAGRAAAVHGPSAAPKQPGDRLQPVDRLQPGDRTAVADWSTGALGGVPIAARPPSARDSAHTSSTPKGDHLLGAAPVLPGGIGIGDPTGTRGQRGSLAPGDQSAVLGRTPHNAPVTASPRGAAGRVGAAGVGAAAGMGGFAPHAAPARGDEDREHKRTVYLDEDVDTLVGPMPSGVTPVIGVD